MYEFLEGYQKKSKTNSNVEQNIFNLLNPKTVLSI